MKLTMGSVSASVLFMIGIQVVSAGNAVAQGAAATPPSMGPPSVSGAQGAPSAKPLVGVAAPNASVPLNSPAPAAAGEGQLKFDADRQTVYTVYGQSSSVALYRFQNVGKAKVGVQGGRTSCGCLGAEIDWDSYNPGDRGELRVRYQAKPQAGSSSYVVTVMTDIPSHRDYFVQMTVVPLSNVELSEGELVWPAGGPAKQVIKLKVNDPLVAKAELQIPQNVWFQGSAPVKNGDTYEFTVMKVKDMAQDESPFICPLLLYTEGGETKSLMITMVPSASGKNNVVPAAYQGGTAPAAPVPNSLPSGVVLPMRSQPDATVPPVAK